MVKLIHIYLYVCILERKEHACFWPRPVFVFSMFSWPNPLPILPSDFPFLHPRNQQTDLLVQGFQISLHRYLSGSNYRTNACQKNHQSWGSCDACMVLSIKTNVKCCNTQIRQQRNNAYIELPCNKQFLCFSAVPLLTYLARIH